MTKLRQTIARRLKESQNTAAILTTFNEIDMGAVMELRNHYKDDFAKKHGVKLGFMSFFVKAACDALKLVPQVNAEVRGETIVMRSYCDVGVAVGSGKGLVVPVARSLGSDHAEVTRGGVALGEIDARTMQSKVRPGLFVCGELLDVDGPIGGFNFQAAFATGRLAGLHA
jgi:2-oxoglutarate dehydrogenase E2 component (dihydrolipoamide succinyltransferase)